MEEKIRCQSCGMPLGPGAYGTETNGAASFEYCKYCYERGSFLEPHLTLEEMIAESVKHMTTKMNFPKEQAEQMSREVIPGLKRWKQ